MDFDVVLLRAVRKGMSERDQVVCIDGKTQAAFKSAKTAVEKDLSGLHDREIKLALLAELVDELLGNKLAVEPPNREEREDSGLRDCIRTN